MEKILELTSCGVKSRDKKVCAPMTHPFLLLFNCPSLQSWQEARCFH